ncbi:carbonic anhydrase [Ammoniphilus sp. YIM 78166]|uniref:beta-class carbonic anhydrase n=1 Tax=Ammoniphilus sp. YIM 78166 TaxID=1644106 RepID=UPI00107065F5|nr:carbonic anhydrase [Ammoniphilus sp. YIM 78166]
MTSMKDILDYNHSFVENAEYERFRTTKFPDRRMVILTCMDTRLIELLPHAMGFKNGDVKIIKNAGAIVSHPFGSIMRSILVAIYELNAQEVCVIGHHDCGMTGLHSSSILEKIKTNGISQERIDILSHAGVDLTKWLTGFENVKEAVTNSVRMIQNHPLLPSRIPVHGLIIHPETGRLDWVVNGYPVETEQKEAQPLD